MKLEYVNLICPKCGNENYMRHLVGKNVGELNVKCINCNSYFKLSEFYRMTGKAEPKQLTNYDRLVSKTPEELAEWVTGVMCKTVKPYMQIREKVLRNDEFIKWLKSPEESSVFESMKRGLQQAINGETRSETLTKDGDKSG